MSYKTVRAGPQLVWRTGKDCLSLGQMSKLCPVCAQSCSPLCDPMDCSPPGSSVHGIFQARILEWLAISSSRGSSRLRDRTHVSCIGRQVLYHWATWEAHECLWGTFKTLKHSAALHLNLISKWKLSNNMWFLKRQWPCLWTIRIHCLLPQKI